MGAELIKISLESNGICLEFAGSTVRLFSAFQIRRRSQWDNIIEISARKGDLESLWALVGHKVERVTLEGVAEFAFSNACVIYIPEGRYRGEIISSSPLDQDGIGWDEF